MKFTILNIPPAGFWKRDCELINFNMYPLSLEFIRDSDNTKWKVTFDDFLAFKVTSEEFTVHLTSLPENGSFYLVEDSFWVNELKKINLDVAKNCNHYLFFFYDDVVEVVSKNMNFKKIE